MALSNAKNLWRRSIRLGTPDTPHIMGQDMFGTEPVTLAIIGCGQRGKVRRQAIRDIYTVLIIPELRSLCPG